MFITIEEMFFSFTFKQMFLLNYSKVIRVVVPELWAVCTVAVGRSSGSEVQYLEIKWVLGLTS